MASKYENPNLKGSSCHPLIYGVVNFASYFFILPAMLFLKSSQNVFSPPSVTQ